MGGSGARTQQYPRYIHLITGAFLTNADKKSDIHQITATLLDKYYKYLLLHIGGFDNFKQIYTQVHSLERFPQ
eukprot:13068743-Ditylum_brightwellii.AAC.1